jgi:hypothetical protein
VCQKPQKDWGGVKTSSVVRGSRVTALGRNLPVLCLSPLSLTAPIRIERTLELEDDLLGATTELFIFDRTIIQLRSVRGKSDTMHGRDKELAGQVPVR